MKNKNPFDYFDKIFCINLDSRPDRWEQVQTEFDKVGILNRVERVSAYRPSKQGKHFIDFNNGEETIHIPYHVGGHIRFANPSAYDQVNAFAVSLSHHSCLVRAMESNVSNYLVFEDDVCFEKYDEEYLKLCLSELPSDWKLFLLGCDAWGRSKCEDFSANLFKIDGFGLAHAYSINHMMFETYRSEFEKRVLHAKTTRKRWWKRVEYFLSHICREFFTAKEQIAFQAEGISDVAAGKYKSKR